MIITAIRLRPPLRVCGVIVAPAAPVVSLLWDEHEDPKPLLRMMTHFSYCGGYWN